MASTFTVASLDSLKARLLVSPVGMVAEPSFPTTTDTFVFVLLAALVRKNDLKYSARAVSTDL